MKEQSKKKQKRHNAVTFKSYNQDQLWLLPPSLGDLIPPNHIVRLVNEVIDSINLEPILTTYKGGGSSSYHPRMMLKALVYGYLDKQYSSRRIETRLRENICYMWLCGMQQPDHGTLNSFRRGKLKGTVKEVFAQVLLLLVDRGYVRLEDYHVDGTKMESVANRYTYVWAKNVARYKASVLAKVSTLLAQIEQANEEAELIAKQEASQATATNEPSNSIQDSIALEQTITQLNKDLAEQLGTNKTLKKQLKKLEEECLPKLQKYETQENKLAGRNSYSKTDEDATFMRTKEDHLKNGQLKPCYNLQFGTNDQYVLNYTIHQTSSDMAVFTDHMTDTLSMYESIEVTKPKRATADAGYGSEENYEFLEAQQIEAYVKYPGYFKESKGNGKHQKNPFHSTNLFYNEAQDFYVCPMGQKMLFQKTIASKTKSGYVQYQNIYQAANCEGCPMRGLCFKAKGNRIIRHNPRAAKYRKQARQRLETLRGIHLKKKRNIDVEPVFGHLKQCRHFRRFLLTGLEGVNIETGLLVIAHNLKKYAVNKQAIRISMPIPFDHPPNCSPSGQINPQLELYFEKLRA